MPVVVFVSPKGGAGKTTAALILATQLARGSTVSVIDADPNRPIHAWAQGADNATQVRVVTNVDEDSIIDRIEEEALRSNFVVVDLEGTAAKIVLLAVSQADLVIIPTQGSQLDAEQAGRALRVVKQQEKMSRRSVPHAVLLTRTNAAIRTRSTSHIYQSLQAAQVPVLATQLNEREAFRAMFSFRRTLEALDPSAVANIDKAIRNAEAFALEVTARLRQARANPAAAGVA